MDQVASNIVQAAILPCIRQTQPVPRKEAWTDVQDVPPDAVSLDAVLRFAPLELDMVDRL